MIIFHYLHYFFYFIFINLILSQSDCNNNRYLEYVYDINIDYDIQYGQNINQNIIGNQINQDLFMNVYYPINDNFNERPLIFFLFGGSFISGSKNSQDIVSLCTKYARMGYVSVAIDYRLSEFLLLTNPSEENGYKAVLKAIHDLKAAIRYFRMNDELFDNYGIDQNRIYAGGYSAGAFACINAAYLNNYEELPEFIIDDYELIGGFEGFSGNPGYESSFNGIINLSGAVGDSDWIVENDIPIISMHGDQDDVVPYANDLVTLFGLNIEVDGSYIIHQRMLELGNISELYTYQNEGHSPYSDMEFEVNFTSQFLYNIVCGNLLLGDLNNDNLINVNDIIIMVNLILNGDFNMIGDINLDEYLNVLDVIQIVNIILGS